LRHRHGRERWMRGEAAIERAQERPPLPFVMLPGILAVQDDEDRGVSPASPCCEARACVGESRDEIVGRGVGVPRCVAEANEIRECVIAESAGDLLAVLADTVRAIERVRMLDVSAVIAEEL